MRENPTISRDPDGAANITMKGPIHINSKNGMEIFNYLKYALNLPDNLVECSVSFKLNDVFVVNCKYYPRARHD